MNESKIENSQPTLQQHNVMRSLLTTDGVDVPIGKYVFYVGGTIISPKPQKRLVTQNWLHGNPLKSYKNIFSTELICWEWIRINYV